MTEAGKVPCRGEVAFDVSIARVPFGREFTILVRSFPNDYFGEAQYAAAFAVTACEVMERCGIDPRDVVSQFYKGEHPPIDIEVDEWADEDDPLDPPDDTPWRGP